jgi:RHS repeat-associated protein
MHWRNRRRVRRRTSGRSFVYNPRFPGQYFDVETGLNYNAYRDYDPATGRYVESDPIGLGGGVNTYSYVNGSPLRLVDLLGLAACGGIDDQCAALRRKIALNAALLTRQLSKYDPVADAKGGFAMRWGSGSSKKGGHYEEIQQLQGRLKRDINTYNRRCRGDNDRFPPISPEVVADTNREVEAPIITPDPDISIPTGDNQNSMTPAGEVLGILSLLSRLVF